MLDLNFKPEFERKKKRILSFVPSLVLAVLLGMLLVQLRPGGERPDDSGRGILESAAYFYRLAAGRIKRSDKKPKVQSTLEAGSLGARIEKDFNRGGSGESIDPEG